MQGFIRPMPQWKDLEEAVAGLVAPILGGMPIGNRTFEISRNKILFPGGVRTEIDVYVREPAANAVYLFECKNLAEPVGKSDVVLFADKIQDHGAIHGFMVAPRFSKYARIRAERATRMTLLESSRHKINPVDLQSFSWVLQRIHCRELITSVGNMRPQLDSTAVVDGIAARFRDVLEIYARMGAAQHVSENLAQAAGIHQMAFEQTWRFRPGGLLIAGDAAESLTLVGEVEFTTVNPTILYGYDVAKRCRFVKFERFQISDDAWADSLVITEAGARAPSLAKDSVKLG